MFLRISPARFCSRIRSFVDTPYELLRLAKPVSPTSLPYAASVNRVIELTSQEHSLKMKRMEVLSLPAGSVSNRNKEIVSLMIGAVSGALSLSFHPGFAVIFYFSYRMYKNANAPTIQRLNGPAAVREINENLRKIREEVDLELTKLRNVPLSYSVENSSEK